MVFQGLRTLIFGVKKSDLKKATDWYTQLLGKPPHFEESFYVGFNVGGFELGLEPSEEKLTQGDNVQTYWGVKDIQESKAHCLKAGAQIHSDIRDVGGDIQVATLRDPFGNIFGLIKNPHFKIEEIH